MRIARMRRAGVASAAVALAGLAMLVLPSTAASAAPQRHFNRTICSSGIVFPGIYTSLLVIGSCQLTETGTVTVLGLLRVGQYATFDAVTDGTLNVRGNVEVDEGGTLDVGCNPVTFGAPCLSVTHDVIDGSVSATNPLEMVWHNVSVGGGYNVSGSVDNTSCESADQFGLPDYFTVEDSWIGGSLVYDGVQTCWLGAFRDHVRGNMRVDNNMTNTTIKGIAFDSPELASNLIRGGLYCYGNVPKPTFGDSHGRPNIAGRGKHGQCRHL